MKQRGRGVAREGNCNAAPSSELLVNVELSVVHLCLMSRPRGGERCAEQLWREPPCEMPATLHKLETYTLKHAACMYSLRRYEGMDNIKSADCVCDMRECGIVVDGEYKHIRLVWYTRIQ